MATMSMDFAKSMLRSAQVEQRKDSAKAVDPYPYKKLFRIKTDTLKSKDFRPQTDVPIPQKTSEGEPAPVGEVHEPDSFTASVDDYKVEIRIHKNAAHYDQTGEIKKLSSQLTKTEEVCYDKHCASVFNNGFTSGYTGPDGKTLFAVDHPLKAGGTCANRFSSSQSLTLSNVESGISYMMLTKNNQGEYIAKTPMYLVVGASQWSTACKICNSMNAPGTANNDLNVVKSEIKLIPVLWVHITSSTAWYLVCPPEENGLILYKTRKIEIDTGMDVHTGFYIYVVHLSFDYGWCDWRGCFGDPGA